MAPNGQGGQWQDVLCCSLCNQHFGKPPSEPVSLICGHVICRKCAKNTQTPTKPCPNDDWKTTLPIAEYPTNVVILSIIRRNEDCMQYSTVKTREEHEIERTMIEIAGFFEKAESERGGSVFSQKLSRTLQRKVVSLICYQWAEADGRMKCLKACKGISERVMIEILVAMQSNTHVSSQLWTAVRARGCQFLGPAMQEDVLRLILITLENGEKIARKNLVMYVVSTLEQDYPQVSKTCVGHVVQLLYRASCFNVIKREGESSLMQLKEEFRTYEALRREHDSQIVQIAFESGLRIGPDQWSALLYADQGHRSHMQSIIDKLQSPNAYAQCLEEIIQSCESENPPFCGELLWAIREMRTFFEFFAEIPADEQPTNELLADYLQTLLRLLQSHVRNEEIRKTSGIQNGVGFYEERKYSANGRFKTKMCQNIELMGRCEKGQFCSFAHSLDELREPNGPPNNIRGQNVQQQMFTIPPPPILHHQQQQQQQQQFRFENVYNDPRRGYRMHPQHQQQQFRSQTRMQYAPTPAVHNSHFSKPPPMSFYPPQMTQQQAVPPQAQVLQPPPGTLLIGPGPGPSNGPPPTMQSAPSGPNTVMIVPPPTHHVQPGQVVMMSTPPQMSGGPPAPPPPNAIWAAQSPTGPPGNLIFPAAQSPPIGQHPHTIWIQSTQASIFPIESYDYGLGGGMIWAATMNSRDSGADAEQLLAKRTEILKRLDPPLSIDEDEGEDGGIGHVSYTVASSVLDDTRTDSHGNPIALLTLTPGQPIDLPAIPVTFGTAPNEETMTIIGEMVQQQQGRPRAGSLTQTAPIAVQNAVINGTPTQSPSNSHNQPATVQSECGQMNVMDSISQPIVTSAIQKTPTSSTTIPVATVVAAPVPVVTVPVEQVAEPFVPSVPPPTAAVPVAVPVAPGQPMIVDGATGMLTPMIRPILVPTYPQDVVSNSLDKIVDVKERLSEAQGNASEAENAHLRMELRMAESEMAYLDPFTKNNCLLRELQQVDRELHQLAIEGGQ